MFRRLIVNASLSLSVIASLIGGAVQVSAQAPSPAQFDAAWTTLQRGLGQASVQSGMKTMSGPATQSGTGQMRVMTAAERKAAALRQAARQMGVSQKFAGIDPATAQHSPLNTSSKGLSSMQPASKLPSAPQGNALSAPDYFGVANWANSPLPVIDATGNVTGGMRKFVDTLPGLSLPTTNTVTGNDIGQYLPVAAPDAISYAGILTATPPVPAADYYEIGLVQYREQLHADLPPVVTNPTTHVQTGGTLLRGYVQIETSRNLASSKHIRLYNTDGTPIVFNGAPVYAVDKPSYLGPTILAARDRPVRVKFTNFLPAGAGGDLFIPTDNTYMGAGNGPDGVNPYTENRATLHLHGGNTPWISDGTQHQWTVPISETTTIYRKGDSVSYVPDMWFTAAGVPITSCSQKTTCAVAGATNNPGAGALTFYWTNQQGGRLMFYHDHAYGITRLNVYVGEAAGFLISAPTEENLLAAATVPGTIGATPDLAHVMPLVIQDKTFVPDNGAAGGQLAATDPTWDTAQFGGKGNLWFPHVYTPNQNPADITGANAFGRWDYGPWFWPPQDPTTLVSQPYQCTSSAYTLANPPAFPPLVCPGLPNPSGVPEGFMDTPLVNGTAYPSLSVDPAAYRFHVLNAANDRTMNYGLYVADPLQIALTNGGSGYVVAPTVVITRAPGDITGSGATATADLSTGAVHSILITNVGAGYYTSAPNVTISGNGISATAVAIIDPISGEVVAVNMTNIGTGYTTATVTIDPPAGCVTGCVTATATAVIIPAGVILDVSVTNPGTGWTANPIISFTRAPTDTTGAGAKAISAINSEVKMVGAVPPSSSSTLQPCSINPTTSGAQLALATVDANGNPINGTGLQANCWPSSWPTDGRDGGVPDPTTAGPPIIQIGTEGGLLPSAVVIPSTPTSYEYNRRSITVLNIWTHGLLLGPAERADIVVDFSKYAGKTLILYNDSPAPVPAFDPRNDYYTGSPDQSMMGGAPTTLPGYGPNTRTIMQIKVAATATNPNVTPFSLKSVATAMPNIFAQTQDKILVAEPGYPAANGNGPSNYVRIQDTSISGYFGTGGSIDSVTLTNGGSGYTAIPTVAINGGGGSGATAVAALVPTSVGVFSLTLSGSGYITAPLVTINGGGGTGAAATTTLAGTSVATLQVLTQGAGYIQIPTVTISAPPAGGTRATARAVVSRGKVIGLTFLNQGAGYTSAPSVVIAAPVSCVLNTTTCIRATAVATLTATGVGSINFVAGGSGYTSAPTVVIGFPPGQLLTCDFCQATAIAILKPTSVANVTLVTGGAGYTSVPTVTITRGAGDVTGAGATAIASVPKTPLQPKAIQELFTLDYGRMNATLGVEIPRTNFQTQTTIPYGNTDPPTEILKAGDVQVWKITHNGVDTHFIHFHLFNVQVINRVGWDGAIKPPDTNEIGWKDTVRMNPLEDIIVALRPMTQTLPWDLPNNVRLLDVTQPVGANLMNTTGVDPTGQPAAVVNSYINFGYEYVWHCHILGHEENDMMRSMILGVPPRTPGTPTVTRTAIPTQRVAVRWADNSKNETGFTIQRSSDGGTTWSAIGTALQNAVVYTDTTVASATTYRYRVIANNLVGDTDVYQAPSVGYPNQSFDSPPTASSLPVSIP